MTDAGDNAVAPQPNRFELGTDGPTTIVVGIDDSETSWRALHYAIGLARRESARVVAVFARPAGLTSLPYPAYVGCPVPPDQATGDDALARAVAELGREHRVEVTFAVSEGDPVAAITAAAEQYLADLIVVGASSKLGHKLFGSTAGKAGGPGPVGGPGAIGGPGAVGEAVQRALWEGVARGLVMCDGFGAIRARVTPRPPAAAGRRLSRLSRLSADRARPADSAGRWSLVPEPDAGVDAADLAEAVAEQLLVRWGVVCRALAVREAWRLPWRELQWALRRLEDRGLVLGGRFVAGQAGEQYALPEAAEQLARVRRLPLRGERVVLNATDPLNLVGVIVPGPTVPAVRTNVVTYVDGLPEG